jgi:hydrogenase expression/formation protein HypC
VSVCLGVPGKVLTIAENAQGMAMGTVSFGGIKKEVCLAYLPEVKPGDYVIVHVGFAISQVSEAEAAETFELLRQMGELEELEADAPAGGGPSPAPSRSEPGAGA